MGKDLKGKELGAGYRQRPDGRYEGRWTDTAGKKHSVYGKTLREVRTKLREAELSAPQKACKEKDCTVDEWFYIWLETYKKGFLKENTIYRYKIMYDKHISPRIGSYLLSDVRRIDVQTIISEMQSKGLSAASQLLVKKLCYGIFKQAVQDEMLLRNPADGVNTARKSKYDGVVLTKEQEQIFLERSFADFYGPILGVQFNTGLRAGELFGLKTEDVDLAGGYIYVKRTLVIVDGKNIENSPKTETSIRRVPINSDCRMYLERWMEQRRICAEKNTGQVCEYFFCNGGFSTLTLSGYNSAISRLVRSINMTLPVEKQIPIFRSHAMRRSFATRCFEAGVPPKVVQKYLGHTNIQTTMDIYTKVFDDIDPQMVEKISWQVVKGGQKVVNQKENGVVMRFDRDRITQSC